MARFTFNIELDSKPDHNGLTAVMIRLHQKNQKPVRIQTSVKIQEPAKYWSLLEKKRKAKEADRLKVRVDWGKWVVKHIDAAALNTAIENEYNRIKGQTQDWQREQVQAHPELTESTLTPKQIKDLFDNVRPVEESYFDLADSVLEGMKTLSFGTWSNRRTALNLLKQFTGEEITLAELNVPKLEAFQNWLRKTYESPKTKTTLKPSSINLYMDALTTLHEGVLQGRGYSERKAKAISPFSEITPLKSKTAYRAKFDEAAIDKLKVQEVTTRRRRVTPSNAFSIWVLSHLLAGMRFGDLLSLRYMNFTLNEQGQPVHL
ncbi:MAG: hypothetical protein EOO39_48830, partial [Cytophagaceae bacterium]